MSKIAAFRLNQPHDATPDRELIARTLGGDETAFGILVERFQRKIYRIAFAIVRDEMEADAVTQDTFVQAYMSLSKFEGRSELETWLTRIAINRSRDTLRRRRLASLFRLGAPSDGDEPVLEIADERPGPERELAASQLRAAIRKAEAKLSQQQLIIFRLRHYENLSLEEIAERIGLRAGTVRAHLFRAVHKIRRELAGWQNRPLQRTTP